MLCLDIIKAVEKERGKSPVLSQSFRFEDLRCDRRIRDIYILFIYCIYIYKLYIYIWLDESQLEPERVVYLFTNVLVVGGLHLLWCTILAQVGFHAFVLYLFYPPSHTLYYGGSYFMLGSYFYDRRVSPITLAIPAFHLCFIACSRVSQYVLLIFI